jgi:hypothetical protein
MNQATLFVIIDKQGRRPPPYSIKNKSDTHTLQIWQHTHKFATPGNMRQEKKRMLRVPPGTSLPFTWYRVFACWCFTCARACVCVCV